MPNQHLRYACYPCKRKFSSVTALEDHRKKSELHAQSIDDLLDQKEDLKQSVLRRMSSQADSTFKKLQLDYGSVQERLEADTSQRETLQYNTMLGKLHVVAGAASWQGNKEYQEDRYIIDLRLTAEDGRYVIGFAVLDGHSGSLCVDEVLDTLPSNLQEYIGRKVLTEENLLDATKEACRATDEQFKSKARKDRRGKVLTDGTTMILCLMFLDESLPGSNGADGGGRYKMVIANLGDSRAVLCRVSQGKAHSKRLSNDHKPDHPEERRRIEAYGGIVERNNVWRVHTPSPAIIEGRYFTWGLAVSRAFGDIQMKEAFYFGCKGVSGPLVIAEPEIVVHDLDLNEDRFLILACDGIWDVLSDDDAIECCLQADGIDHAAPVLVRRAFENFSEDNLTAVVIAWKEELPSSRSPHHSDVDIHDL